MESSAAQAVVEARQLGPFRSLADFCTRTKLGRRAIEGLIAADAFDGRGASRRQLLWDLQAALDGGQVREGGAVVYRQQPPTAGGTVFLALEDTEGIVNVILHLEVAEAHRAALRSPFVAVEGRVQRQMRGDAQVAKVPVIVATAYPELVEGVKEEADLVLVKPVRYSVL